MKPQKSNVTKNEGDDKFNGTMGNNQQKSSTDESKCCTNLALEVTSTSYHALQKSVQKQPIAGVGDPLHESRDNSHDLMDRGQNVNVNVDERQLPKPTHGGQHMNWAISPLSSNSTTVSLVTLKDVRVSKSLQVDIQLKGVVPPCHDQSPSAQADSTFGEKCQFSLAFGDRCHNLNIEGATRGPLRQPSSFSLGTPSTTNYLSKKMFSPAKDQIQISSNLNDDCIRNQNCITLLKHSKKKTPQILEIGKTLGVTIKKSEIVTLQRLEQLQTHDLNEIREVAEAHKRGVEEGAL
ncbi:hypothetical protein VNO78_14705 [Psophocarpus tetragonolobus]|uniref:Uncharacterized protein n=1 Tax=Psophocarpus tetragonolobus TaxID=3891 RepID=A0AAN9XJ24_PSOTE